MQNLINVSEVVNFKKFEICKKALLYALMLVFALRFTHKSLVH